MGRPNLLLIDHQISVYICHSCDGRSFTTANSALDHCRHAKFIKTSGANAASASLHLGKPSATIGETQPTTGNASIAHVTSSPSLREMHMVLRSTTSTLTVAAYSRTTTIFSRYALAPITYTLANDLCSNVAYTNPKTSSASTTTTNSPPSRA